MEWKIRKWKNAHKKWKTHKTCRVCRRSTTSKSPRFFKAFFSWGAMLLATMPSLELVVSERGGEESREPLLLCSIQPCMHWTMCHSKGATPGWLPFQPPCLANVNPEYVHWIPAISAQPLIPFWGGSSSRSSWVSQHGYQGSSFSTGGLARHHRDGNRILQSYSDGGELQCGLLLRGDFLFGHIYVCMSAEPGYQKSWERGVCISPWIWMSEKYFKWPGWKCQIKIAANFGENSVKICLTLDHAHL